MEAIVEQVRDGSSLRVYLLPDFQFVQVFVAGITASSGFNEMFLLMLLDFTDMRVLNRDVSNNPILIF